ncbi:MAG TPA: TraR/DksA family transcriptional regulator [Thermoanaerobaculia bacterium]|nr:TraR/DksA family transcriptional regulator [Thermoanaerobaculia bacterium]
MVETNVKPVLPSQELAALREKLIEERDRLTAEYRQDVTEARAIQQEGLEDFEELASMDADRERLLIHSEQDRERLLLVEEALQRMADGTYGRCLLCGEPIPLERLRLIPWARYGATVQEKIERGEIAAPD